MSETNQDVRTRWQLDVPESEGLRRNVEHVYRLKRELHDVEQATKRISQIDKNVYFASMGMDRFGRGLPAGTGGGGGGPSGPSGPSGPGGGPDGWRNAKDMLSQGAGMLGMGGLMAAASGPAGMLAAGGFAIHQMAEVGRQNMGAMSAINDPRLSYAAKQHAWYGRNWLSRNLWNQSQTGYFNVSPQEAYDVSRNTPVALRERGYEFEKIMRRQEAEHEERSIMRSGAGAERTHAGQEAYWAGRFPRERGADVNYQSAVGRIGAQETWRREEAQYGVTRAARGVEVSNQMVREGRLNVGRTEDEYGSAMERAEGARNKLAMFDLKYRGSKTHPTVERDKLLKQEAVALADAQKSLVELERQQADLKDRQVKSAESLKALKEAELGVAKEELAITQERIGRMSQTQSTLGSMSANQFNRVDRTLSLEKRIGWGRLTQNQRSVISGALPEHAREEAERFGVDRANRLHGKYGDLPGLQDFGGHTLEGERGKVPGIQRDINTKTDNIAKEFAQAIETLMAKVVEAALSIARSKAAVKDAQAENKIQAAANERSGGGNPHGG
jgi:hypothetical protein